MQYQYNFDPIFCSGVFLWILPVRKISSSAQIIGLIGFAEKITGKFANIDCPIASVKSMGLTRSILLNKFLYSI